MEPIAESLRKRLQARGLDQAISASVLTESANRVLPPACRAKTFKNGILTISVASGEEAYFFKQDKEQYIERINAALYEPVVKDLIFRVTHES